MSIYRAGEGKIVKAEQILAATMYANKKLTVTRDDISNLISFINKYSKKNNFDIRIEWDNEMIKCLRRENPGFYISGQLFACGNWDIVRKILSYCDEDVLDMFAEYLSVVNKINICPKKNNTDGLTK